MAAFLSTIGIPSGSDALFTLNGYTNLMTDEFLVCYRSNLASVIVYTHGCMSRRGNNVSTIFYSNLGERSEREHSNGVLLAVWYRLLKLSTFYQ